MNRSHSQALRVALMSADDSGQQQLVKVTGLAGQQIGEAVRVQHFGLSSNPPAGGEGLLIGLGGGHDRSHVIGLEHPRYRPVNLPAGAAVFYDSSGNLVQAQGSKIFVKPKDNTVIIYLGGDGSDPSKYDFVMTASGASVNVKARFTW